MARHELSRADAERPRRSKSRPIKWMEEVVSAPPTAECIAWPFSKRASGYGQVFYHGVRTTSSRIICQMYRGHPPHDGAQAAHECGNRQCCNPRHIVWKTARENSADKKRHGTLRFGERVYNAKLTDRDVIAIRDRCARGEPLSDIAQAFGVCKQTICDVKLRKIWRHVS